MGLDPGLGLLHADQKSRDSLPCDVMEPVRPAVDAYVLSLLQSRVFTKSEFFETREGICRIMPPLTLQLAEPVSIWAKELGSITERVAVCYPRRRESRICRSKEGSRHTRGFQRRSRRPIGARERSRTGAKPQPALPYDAPTLLFTNHGAQSARSQWCSEELVEPRQI
jgi:hypothetical protein